MLIKNAGYDVQKPKVEKHLTHAIDWPSRKILINKPYGEQCVF